MIYYFYANFPKDFRKNNEQNSSNIWLFSIKKFKFVGNIEKIQFRFVIIKISFFIDYLMNF